MEKLYKAYSLIPASRLPLQQEEDDIRVDWICYLRDDPLPCSTLIENFPDLAEQARMMEDEGYLRWIQNRTNNLLREAEVEELREYLTEKYNFPIYVETMNMPIPVNDLPWFKENYIDSMIILSDRDDPFTLSTCIVGMVSPYKNLNNVNTVKEFLKEIDKQRSSKYPPEDLDI